MFDESGTVFAELNSKEYVLWVELQFLKVKYSKPRFLISLRNLGANPYINSTAAVLLTINGVSSLFFNNNPS